jgi:predicted aspartyl protease
VPINMAGHAIHITVVVGGESTDMILDTGAPITLVTPALANSLINSGQATELQPIEVTMANGSKEMERVISVRSLTIGSHTRTNVSVSESDGMQLLGLPVLSAIGRFSIDSVAGELTFG